MSSKIFISAYGKERLSEEIHALSSNDFHVLTSIVLAESKRRHWFFRFLSRVRKKLSSKNRR